MEDVTQAMEQVARAAAKYNLPHPVRFVVEGHTNNAPGVDKKPSKIKLSDDRAAVVWNHLLEPGEGSGSTKPGLTELFKADPELKLDTRLEIGKRGFGGVRIEDDVMCTKTGHDVLSREVPKERAALEALVGSAR